MQYDANGALLKTEIPGVKLVNRGKVRDVYDLGDALLFVAVVDFVADAASLSIDPPSRLTSLLIFVMF